jgi:hypothetical protein
VGPPRGGDGAVRAAHRSDHLVLRRRVRHRAGPPAWSAAGVAGPLIINGFLDAQGKPGTLTAEAYRPALFTMVAVLAVGFIANVLIRPVPERYHEAAAPSEPLATVGERSAQ